MDPGGPPEGAPGDLLDMQGVDKVVDVADNWHSENSASASASASVSISPSISDQPRKIHNNRLLFLTVIHISPPFLYLIKNRSNKGFEKIYFCFLF